jgi:hypothetical protein
MSDILDTAVEFTAATTRWSTGGSRSLYMTTGTIWYGMMCRSFVLLERLLRSCLIEFSRVDESLVAESRRRRGYGRALDSLTMGQCFGVLEDLSPRVMHNTPNLNAGGDLLPEGDLKAWQRIVSLRNRMAHHGPGFLDSIDLFSGRVWREYEVQEPLEQQAKDVWKLGRQVCRSRVVFACVSLSGVSPEEAIIKLDAAETIQFTFKEISTLGNQAIDAFHALEERTSPSAATKSA